ncbi:hypothetical protein INT43_008790 [Umbelopsis isabellina]|uniref:Uncharacterized protein n=1 Tax=Mortierella isabellina TaxID=91625 RepID=A0A8H7UIN2_MORIS|nr:hypothetical protein INT43_008790 [Umbelopsis isabellina]
MTAEPTRSGTPGRNNLVIQRDFHGRLLLCDHIRNTMITAEDWIAHERYRVGQDIQPRHCDDYDMLTQIIDDVFHLQQESYDSWVNNKTDRIPVKAPLDSRPALIVKACSDTTGDEMSQLNTPNLSPTSVDMTSQKERQSSPDHSLPQTPSPVQSPVPTSAKNINTHVWKSPLHRLYFYSSKVAGCVNVLLELESLHKLCESWETTTNNLHAFQAILSNHVAALIQSIALDASENSDFATMMDIRAELILYLESKHNWSMMSGRFTGNFNLVSFMKLVTEAQRDASVSSELDQISESDSNHQIIRPGKRRSLHSSSEDLRLDAEVSSEEVFKKKRQESISALQERLHKMKVEIEQTGLAKMHPSEDSS